MNDDKVVIFPNTEEEPERDLRLEMERLNVLLGAAAGALRDAQDADSGIQGWKDGLACARRLHRELGAAMGNLGGDIPKGTVTVRVKGQSGEDEQHEVAFPIYALGEGRYRRIDKDMVEVSFSHENVPLREEFCLVRRVVNFLDGQGPDYWLGRGDFELGEETFDIEFEEFLLSVSRVFEEEANGQHE